MPDSAEKTITIALTHDETIAFLRASLAYIQLLKCHAPSDESIRLCKILHGISKKVENATTKEGE